VDFQIRITEAALADFEEILVYSWANFPATAIYYRVDEARNFVEILHFWRGSRGESGF
jgi:hypothetical protein